MKQHTPELHKHIKTAQACMQQYGEHDQGMDLG